MEIRKNLEVFFWLLVQFLAKFSNMEKEWSEKVLEDTEYFFNPAIDKDSSNERFKDIAHDLAWLEDFNLAIVHFEVLLERVADVSV